MTIDITELERRHGNFYVPAFKVLVDGKDLLTKIHSQIASVQVDNTLGGCDRFTFLVNGTFDFKTREFEHLFNHPDDLFKFGSAVEVHFGYQDSLSLLHRGTITSVQTAFPATGLPQITVSGYDLSYCMAKGKKSDSWTKKKDSEVVSEIAARKTYGLTPTVKDSSVVHPKTTQSQESDYAFLKRLAKRNGFELYTFDKTLYFRPPANADPAEPAVVTLEWGKGLVSFSPEVNISEQVSTVEVRGWNVNTKKEIVGKAKQGDEPGRDQGRRSGAEFLKSTCRDAGDLKVRFPVFSQQEADRMAKAILKKRAELFVRGSGESIGLPEIRADKNIELRGLGKLFNKTYYVEQSTHTINASGYRTTFKVKETTI